MKLTEITKKPTLWMPIGASGTGKSFYLKKLRETHPNIRSFSWDDLRHEWYDAKSYGNAFRLASKDKDFEKKARAVFETLIESGQDIYVDNTNLSVIRRSYYINLAKQHGYRTVGVEMPVDVETIVARQQTRGDKRIKADIVRAQFAKLEPPGENEFDEVIVSNHNTENK